MAADAEVTPAVSHDPQDAWTFRMNPGGLDGGDKQEK